MLIDFDIKEKIKALMAEGKEVPKEYFDIGVAYWLINPDEGDYDPAALSKKYLKRTYKGKESDIGALQKFAVKKLKEYGLEKLFYEVEMPLVAVLAEMERWGIGLDLAALKKIDARLSKGIEKAAEAIYKEAGEIFNINSPKQLGQVLFEKMGIDAAGVKKTKGGAISTNIDTLMLIKDRHPAVGRILEYRELFKLQSTYVRPLQELADASGRVHTTYVQTGAATGRLSSQNPNLQNIPVGNEWATELRKCFIAGEGYAIAAFDYSQIELRILASLSGDAKMLEAFSNGDDIHALTAASVFNVPLEKVAPDMRRLGKTLNFGIVYGMGAVAFAKQTGVKIADARKFIAAYFENFKGIKVWQEEIKAFARTYGYVASASGRRRWLLKIASYNHYESAEAERAAINMPVQGLAADIVKIAMLKVAQALQEKGWWGTEVKMLLTIHDELLFEVSGNIIEEAAGLIRKTMESAYPLDVPLKVTEKSGASWAG